jgi:acyl-CoA reductase-like NAD-dependent aldehyde dehydrogenase
VFTQDLKRGFKITKEIESGAVHIKGITATVHDETALPHGGAKASGFGRFNGREGLKKWFRSKTVIWQDCARKRDERTKICFLLAVAALSHTAPSKR